MMGKAYSCYLEQVEDKCQQLVDSLKSQVDYVSILGCDVQGIQLMVKSNLKQIFDPMSAERGFVVRIQDKGRISEYSFNEMGDVQRLANQILNELKQQQNVLDELQIERMQTPFIEEIEDSLESIKNVEIGLSEFDVEKAMERFDCIVKAGMALDSRIFDCAANYSLTQVNKLFISSKKHLKQSYTYSEVVFVAMARGNDQIKRDMCAISGCKGAEILNEIDGLMEKTVSQTLELLDSEPLQPGEYDIICTPEIAGLIAHEAFGHGVEMDMFVKHRALAENFIGEQIANELVDMHDGALACEDVASFAFDDEGILAKDTVIIKQGVLKSGISDQLSALRLNTVPTGNGRRESFENKAYARMTNTLFKARQSTLDEMLSSIKYGYLLDGVLSGMEDPKHWGIQCLIAKGKEIKDGKLTGKVVSPVILTGYVPDLLKSITMCGSAEETSGCGYCGKGHKEWVKVSDGGPYLKAKGRLG